ncbi:MAG: hypothetical protein IJU64_01570 [Bacilli bacterium]|nr:hypothetical protein [Bacilli bacterium]
MEKGSKYSPVEKQNKPKKYSLGNITLWAILETEHKSQFDRLCRYGSMVIPDFTAKAWDFVNHYVAREDGKCTTEELNHYAEILGAAVDTAHFDPFWWLVYRTYVRYLARNTIRALKKGQVTILGEDEEPKQNEEEQKKG